jgi:hypothetical protein
MLIFWPRKVNLRGHINSVKKPPHTQASDPLPPEPKEGGHTFLRLRGRGGPNSDDWRKTQHSTLFYVQKKHKIRQMNPTVQYSVYTETT